ncbi:hypothetical protein AGMMS49525_03190 [Bacteroidia bacterium]|nr:hypothetical protein AGMMS49525_03190 [Bacteroidia bacterium]
MADMLDNQDFVYAHIKNLKAKLHKADCRGMHSFTVTLKNKKTLCHSKNFL